MPWQIASPNAWLTLGSQTPPLPEKPTRSTQPNESIRLIRTIQQARAIRQDYASSMSSTVSSTGSGRRYKALPPPKQQRTFTSAGSRRPSRPNFSVIRPSKKQSSLTQMQWTATPRQVIDVPSDDDDEWEERPAKRRKRSTAKAKKGKLEEREAGQSSFTQVDYLGRMGRPRRSDVDDDGFQIWHDSDTEADIASSSPTQKAASSAHTTGSENAGLEIPESSQAIDANTTKDKLPVSGAERLVTGPRTPQKVRFAEVPSSQTPPSTRKTASLPALRSRSLSRSPLKERSVNVHTSLRKPKSPESQNMTMKMLENVRFRQRAQREWSTSQKQLDDDLQRCAAEATDELSIRTYRMSPPLPGRLARTTTIQDSQAEDFHGSYGLPRNGGTPESVRTGTVADSQKNSSNETLAEDSQFQQPIRRELKRIATVQDSQCSDSDDGFDDDEASAEQYDGHATAHDCTYDPTRQQHTFPEGTWDPAFSALARDATRFQWTQTQPQLSEVDEHSETEDEDLDRGCASRTSPRNRGLQSSTAPAQFEGISAVETDQISQHPCGTQHGVPDDTEESISHTDAVARDDSAYGSDNVVVTSKSFEIPSSSPPASTALAARLSTDDPGYETVRSSPPLLRPSQVSTIVPTQASIATREPSPLRKVKQEPLTQTPASRRHPQAYSLMISPQKSCSLWQPESLSSSPLPLPPWTSPEKHRLTRPSCDKVDGSLELGSDVQMNSLADFSLPPPPPLSSSRRQTPASSSL